MSDWNSSQYLQFEKERTQPSIDLVKRIQVVDPRKIIDIGCGPGNSTNVLANHFNGAFILGIDNSVNMIEKAKNDYPNLTFRLCDASKNLCSLESDFDIVFSNATLQWLPNHRVLIKELVNLLNVGGVLAVQIPINHNEPLYSIIEETASKKRWGLNQLEVEVNNTLSASEYFDIISDISDEFSIWETTYFHRMSSAHDLVEWVKGTRLRPLLHALTPEQGVAFEKEIEQSVSKTYNVQQNGEIIFRFRRLFFTIRRTK